MKYYIVFGSSKSIGLELTRNLIKNSNNFVIGLSRTSNNINSKNFYEINGDLNKTRTYNILINYIKERKIEKINHIVFAHRNRSKKVTLESEFKFIIGNTYKFVKKINLLNLFNKKNTNSVIFIDSVLSNKITKLSNIQYSLPRNSLRYLTSYLSDYLKENNVYVFNLKLFIFIKNENKKYYNNKHPLVKEINNESNIGIVKVNNIIDIILYLFTKKSQILNGNELDLSGGLSNKFIIK